jgi:acetyl esterase/lipase
MRKAITITALLLVAVTHAAAEPRVEKNVVYGMYSGLALLMDVYHPTRPNGLAILYVQGSGFNAPLGFNATPLKEGEAVANAAARLTASGYTVFAVNHRAAPRFQYPAAVEDVQRAVRFIRANASTYRIDPKQIGAAGGSSGGHLSARYKALIESPTTLSAATRRFDVNVSPSRDVAWATIEIDITVDGIEHRSWQVAVFRKIEGRWRAVLGFDAALPSVVTA